MIKRGCRLRSRAARHGADSRRDSAPRLAEATPRCLHRCLPTPEPLPASLGHGFRGKGAGAPSLGEVLPGASPRALRGGAGGRLPFQRSHRFARFISQCRPAAPARASPAALGRAVLGGGGEDAGSGAQAEPLCFCPSQSPQIWHPRLGKGSREPQQQHGARCGRAALGAASPVSAASPLGEGLSRRRPMLAQPSLGPRFGKRAPGSVFPQFLLFQPHESLLSPRMDAPKEIVRTLCTVPSVLPKVSLVK